MNPTKDEIKWSDSYFLTGMSLCLSTALITTRILQLTTLRNNNRIGANFCAPREAETNVKKHIFVTYVHI